MNISKDSDQIKNNQTTDNRETELPEFIGMTPTSSHGDKIIRSIGALTFAMGIVELRQGDIRQKVRGAVEIGIGMLWMRR